MKQLHIREPWADLAYKSGNHSILEDLLNRIQVLEARVRELEVRGKAAPEPHIPQHETVPVHTREAIPVGV